MSQHNQIWVFNWAGGGYNSVRASSREEAVALAKGLGEKSQDGRRITLVPLESSFKAVTSDELIEIDREYASLFW